MSAPRKLNLTKRLTELRNALEQAKEKLQKAREELRTAPKETEISDTLRSRPQKNAAMMPRKRLRNSTKSWGQQIAHPDRY